MRYIQLTEYGSPANLVVVDGPDPEPRSDDILIEVDKASVNYSDVHLVRGDYLRRPELPMTPGYEVVGRDRQGRRTLAWLHDMGGWAAKVAVSPGNTYPVPDGVTDEQALITPTAGFTAWHTLRTVGRLTRRDSVLITAAAGGVGSTAIQLAKTWGARRIVAMTSTPEKREFALSLGADAVVDANLDDLAPAIVEANNGRAVDVILEMTGGPVFEQCLAALAPLGRLVKYGNVTSATNMFSADSLMHGSRTVAGFTASDFTLSSRSTIVETFNGLFGMMRKGQLSPVIGDNYPLAEAARALDDLQSRRTMGKLVLDVRA